MCGRFVMSMRADDLAAYLDADVDSRVTFQPSWNIPPTSNVPILVERYSDPVSAEPEPASSATRREIHLARWGLLPRWAESPAFSSNTFNARSETVLTKPSFKDSIRRRRCAVPAEGYYEWAVETGEDGKIRRRPYWVRPADGSLMLFAGVYEWWQDPAAVHAGHPAPWRLTVSILTGPSPEPGSTDGPSFELLDQLGQIHERTPLAMHPETARAWIQPGHRSPRQLEYMLGRLRAEVIDQARGWAVHEVDPAVGSVRNDTPELTEPLPALF